MPKQHAPVALRYCGPVIRPGEGVPLPQGWPAADHDEPDEALAKEKLASKMYQADSPVTGGEVASDG